MPAYGMSRGDMLGQTSSESERFRHCAGLKHPFKARKAREIYRGLLGNNIWNQLVFQTSNMVLQR